MNNKKTIVASIIGVALLVVLVVGATFAYFTTATSNDEGVTNVTGKTDAIGSISLTNPTSDLHITLSALDMSEDNKNTAYYATDDVEKNYDIEEVPREIAVATITGGEDTTYYECTATINVDVSGTMVDGLKVADAYIQFNGLLTHKVSLKNISEDGYQVAFRLNKEKLPSHSLSASLYIKNTNTNQNSIAGKELNVTFSNSDLECNVVEAPEGEGEAFAVYSTDDYSLRFYKNTDEVNVGDTYNDLTVTKIYTGFEDASGVPWTNDDLVVDSILVVDEIIPVSTAKWFSGMDNYHEYDQGFIGINVNVEKLNVSRVTDMSDMFSGLYTMYGVTDISGMENWDTSKVTNMSNMFYEASGDMDGRYFGDISAWDVSNVTDMSYMFGNYSGYGTIYEIGDISKWDTSNVTNMTGMFEITWNYDGVVLDLSGWDVSKVTDYADFNTGAEANITPPKFGVTN